MSKYVVGISAYYHDSSACLFKDGKLVFACEEERFTGIKHDRSFPKNTINYIFKKYGLTKKDVEAVCYYEDVNEKKNRVIKNIKRNFFKFPIFCIKSFIRIIKNKRNVEYELERISDIQHYSTHHISHQHYSFFTSPFKDAVCVSIDGVGEFSTLSFGIYSGFKCDEIKHYNVLEYPHSLGLFYSAMTAFLGFKPNEGEYKLMGLASYGDPYQFIDKVNELIWFDEGKIVCNMDVFSWDRSNRTMYNFKLSKLLGILPRMPDKKIRSVHENLAAAVQMQYEKILFKVLRKIRYEGHRSKNLCLGGGCAYNGTANSKIPSVTSFQKLWIPPAPSDAGSSVGACLDYLIKTNQLNGKITQSPFLGPKYTTKDVLSLVKDIPHRRFNDKKTLYKFLSKKLAEGKVVGWYSGKMEFGARALGHRSILADPRPEHMKDRINQVIKKREGFRPFAPMVIKEKQNEFFITHGDVPYMNQVVRVRGEYQDKLKAITHINGTARIQTVYKNNVLYDLLLEFEKITKYPILLNTSFNVKDKTIVLTPKDALDTFYDTNMDILVMENILIEKQ
jgi:carbamoyltransferase